MPGVKNLIIVAAPVSVIAPHIDSSRPQHNDCYRHNPPGEINVYHGHLPCSHRPPALRNSFISRRDIFRQPGLPLYIRRNLCSSKKRTMRGSKWNKCIVLTPFVTMLGGSVFLVNVDRLTGHHRKCLHITDQASRNPTREKH